MISRHTAILAAFVLASAALAQQPQSESLLDPLRWGVVYDVPATKNVKLEADVPYLRDSKGKLAIDVYTPPDLKRGDKRPAVVFLNTIGDAPAPAPKVKSWGIYRTWPRLVAAHGLVGVSMECDSTRVQDCLVTLFDFLEKHGAEHGIDGTRLGVYAASANVTGASEYLFGDKFAPSILAAVLYYGAPPPQTPRRDLPVLFVVAQSDVPRMVNELGQLWPRVIEKQAPWSLVFGSDMPHAFDAFSDTDDARRLVVQAIAFWKSHLDPMPKQPWEPDPARAIVAALFGNDSRKAAQLLEDWVASHPNDKDSFAALGRARAEIGNFRAAGDAYERALALGDASPGTLAGLGMIRAGQQRWKDATDLLERAVAAGADNSLVLGNLGHAQLMLGRNEDGVRSYERALEAGIPPGPQTRGTAYYNLACGYAKLGKADSAFEKLGKAIDEGFGDRRTLEDDSDLASLRADPRFAQLVARFANR
ncbi:MAG: tetratricopeptide repeat protein [Planctomycetes bacterium]|nr:tetratricopeptide repeat protein [Planctomycetota bacterium]